MKRLEGHYGTVAGSDIKIFEKDGVLNLDVHKLTPHEELVFSAERLLEVKFELDEKEQPTRLVFLHCDHGYWPANFIKRLESHPKQSKEKWEEFKGLYICYYYGIERNYFAITHNESYLVSNSGPRETELYESKISPNLFFTFAGNAYEFKDNYISVGGNVKMFKYEEPVQEMIKLAETEPKHRYLSQYSLNNLENILRILEREKEANQIKQLNEKLHAKR